MNSDDLKKAGFCLWEPLNPQAKQLLLCKVPRSVGVFAIRRTQQFRRKRGFSDIFYVGRGANRNGLQCRIGQCFSPGLDQATNRRILAAISQGEGLYFISWVGTGTSTKASAIKRALLKEYFKEHGELPPENRNLSG